MMKLKKIWFLGLVILIAACQKRKYPDADIQLGDQRIYFTGFVDNAPITLKIGTDGYYCYAANQQLADSIYLFEGTLKKFDCNPCPLSLRVQLADYRQRPPGTAVPADSVFRSGSRGFMPGVSNPVTIKFVSHANKAAASYQWRLSNGVSSQDSIMSCEFAQAGIQTVSLTVMTKGNCESVVVNKIFTGGATGLFACNVTSQPLQNNSSAFSANIVGGVPPFSYSWDFGDNGAGNDSAPTHDYAFAGAYPVKLKIRDAEDHVCESNYIHIAGNDQSSCAANMSLAYAGSRRNAFLNGVRLQWADQSNTILSSDSITQPAESYFEIKDSQPYDRNEKGEAGRLLTFRFNVLLRNGDRKIWLKSDNTAIAVTYK